MRTVKQVFGIDRILRVALLQPLHGPLFFLAPVGVDEGWNISEKLEFIELVGNLLKSLGVRPKVGVMSGGRNTDKGRSPIVDRTMREAEEVVRLALAEGFDCVNAEILIEDAAKSCNIIIAPVGISGNLIFRTLHFLGEGKASGAPILNIDAVFVDTSRAKSDYVDSIALACALANNKKV
jgi:predicted methyltransferase MtxX (methanogen marker protein 4)